MTDLPSTLPALCGVALLLGMRHGFDPDHLATVDALARINAAARPRLARAAGVLFATGHGMVVLAVVMLAATAARAWQLPAWLGAGAGIVSAMLLVALAVSNLVAAFAPGSGRFTAPHGLRTRLVRRLRGARHPAGVAAIGAVFAVAVDTVSMATLLAVAAERVGGTASAAALGALFVVGMAGVGGANGWWVTSLVLRAGRGADVGSRVLAGAVGAVSLAIGAGALVQLGSGSPPAGLSGPDDLLAGGLVCVAVLAASWAGAAWTRRRRSGRAAELAAPRPT